MTFELDFKLNLKVWPENTHLRTVSLKAVKWTVLSFDSASLGDNYKQIIVFDRPVCAAWLNCNDLLSRRSCIINQEKMVVNNICKNQ